MRTKKKGIILLLGLFTVLMTMLFGVGATSASAQELCTHNYVGTTHIATCTEQPHLATFPQNTPFSPFPAAAR